MSRPAWASSVVARRWLAVAALALLLLAGRAATRPFDARTVLSDGARASASCKAPWRSAFVGRPQQRFTLWVMTGGSGGRRDEGIVALGARCRTRARARVAFVASLLVVGGLCAWLARPETPPPGRETMPA